MERKKDFERFYEERLRSEFERLEKDRKQVLRNVKIAWGVVLVLIVAVLIKYWHNFMREPALLTILMFFIPLFIFSYKFLTKNFRKDFKRSIMPPLVKFIDASMEYKSNGRIPQEVFVESKIFPYFGKRSWKEKFVNITYSGEDLVKGTLGDTDFMFSELTVQKLSRRKTRKGDKTRATMIFEGVFFVADFHKEFKGITVVKPQLLFDSRDSSYMSGIGQAVKLEDPEFEKAFNVWGSDQVVSRYVLSTSMMQRILDYKRKTGQLMHLSFVNSKIFVAISWEENIGKKDGKFKVMVRKNLFEPKVFSPLDGRKMAKEFLNDIQIVLDIINDLKLNRRIWTA